MLISALTAAWTAAVLSSVVAQPAVPPANPFLDGSAAGRLQVQVLERCRPAEIASTSEAVLAPQLGRIVDPDPNYPDPDPRGTPEPPLPPECNASCRSRVRFLRFTMRALVEVARGISRQ
jgi:anti-sigma factor RsiW